MIDDIVAELVEASGHKMKGVPQDPSQPEPEGDKRRKVVDDDDDDEILGPKKNPAPPAEDFEDKDSKDKKNGQDKP